MTDIEIICVDDCSTDNSRDILKKYQNLDKRIKVFYSNYNRGTGISRNFAIKHAKGQYILILDPDDFLELNACELAFKQIENNNNDFVIFGNYQYNEKTKSKYIYEYRLLPFCNYFNVESFNIKNFTFPFFNFGSTWGYIFRKNFIEKNNIKYDNLKLQEDVNFLIKAYLNANSISVINLPLYNYRLNRDGAATLNTKFWKDIIKSKIKTLYLLETYKNKTSVNLFIPYLVNSLVHYYHRFMFINRKTSHLYYGMMKKILNKIDENYNLDYFVKYIELNNVREILNTSETKYYIKKSLIKFKNSIIKVLIQFKKIIIIFLKKIKFIKENQLISNPDVSIVVTIYNQEKYINECLDKLISQTHKNIEIICVNDKSTDLSKKIIEKYSSIDKRIFVLNNRWNIGVSKSRNKGLKFSKGKYIIFHDGDDFFYKNTSIEIATQEMNKSQADVGIWGHVILKNNKYEDGHTIKKIKNFYLNNSFDFLQLQTSVTYKIIKKDFLKKNKIKFYPKLSIAEDSMFSYIMHLNNPKYTVINDVLHVWRKHKNSLTNDNVYILKDFFRTIKTFKKTKIFKKQSIAMQLEIVKSWLDGCLHFYNSFELVYQNVLLGDVCRILNYLEKFYKSTDLNNINSYKKLLDLKQL